MAHREDGVAGGGVAAERLDHDGLPVRVEAGGRLIENQDRTAGEQRAGQGDPAALARGQARAAVAEDAGERDVIEGGVPGGGGHGLVRGGGPA